MPTGRHVSQEQRERIWAIVDETGETNLHRIGLLVGLEWQAVRDAVFSACGPAKKYYRLKRKREETAKWQDWGP